MAALPLAWQEGAGFRFAALPNPGHGRAGFTLLPAEATGITFSNQLANTAIAINRLYEIGSGVALGDVDGDGDLDLYVTNYRTDTMFDHPRGFQLQSREQSDGTVAVEPRDRLLSWKRPDGGLQLVEKGEPDILYVGLGQGRFKPVVWYSGVFADETGRALASAPTDWGLTAMFRDFNRDGHPDLYLCNDFVYWPDRLWLNQAARRFQTAPRHVFGNMSLASMAGDVADINRDGHDDLYVADMLSPQREMRAWQRPDILKGAILWPVEDPDFQPEVPRNTLQLARGDGTYAEIAQLAGVAATDWTWSVAFLDVVVNCLHEPARIFRNESIAPRLAIRLRAEGGNTRGIGARIEVTGGPVNQSQEMMAGGRYLSSDDPMRVFAARDTMKLDIEVAWRSGKRSVIRNALPNRVYEIREAEAVRRQGPPPAPVVPLFEDVSSLNAIPNLLPPICSRTTDMDSAPDRVFPSWAWSAEPCSPT